MHGHANGNSLAFQDLNLLLSLACLETGETAAPGSPTEIASPGSKAQLDLWINELDDQDGKAAALAPVSSLAHCSSVPQAAATGLGVPIDWALSAGRISKAAGYKQSPVPGAPCTSAAFSKDSSQPGHVHAGLSSQNACSGGNLPQQLTIRGSHPIQQAFAGHVQLQPHVSNQLPSFGPCQSTSQGNVLQPGLPHTAGRPSTSVQYQAQPAVAPRPVLPTEVRMNQHAQRMPWQMPFPPQGFARQNESAPTFQPAGLPAPGNVMIGISGPPQLSGSSLSQTAGHIPQPGRLSQHAVHPSQLNAGRPSMCQSAAGVHGGIAPGLGHPPASGVTGPSSMPRAISQGSCPQPLPDEISGGPRPSHSQPASIAHLPSSGPSSHPATSGNPGPAALSQPPRHAGMPSSGPASTAPPGPHRSHPSGLAGSSLPQATGQPARPPGMKPAQPEAPAKRSRVPGQRYHVRKRVALATPANSCEMPLEQLLQLQASDPANLNPCLTQLISDSKRMYEGLMRMRGARQQDACSLSDDLEGLAVELYRNGQVGFCMFINLIWRCSTRGHAPIANMFTYLMSVCYEMILEKFLHGLSCIGNCWSFSWNSNRCAPTACD